MEDALTTKFLYAALMGQTDALVAMIDNGADINMKNDSGNTALIFATNEGHINLKLCGHGKNNLRKN